MFDTKSAARAFSVLSLVCSVLVLAPAGPVRAAEVAATFELTVEITWSAATAPLEFPGDAHLSGLIGATHNASYVLFRDGHTASSGLELLAENGRVATLRAEFAEAKRRRRLGAMIDGSNLPALPGRISLRFEAGQAHPLLSFVTMIAPSPDWFTGAADISLMVDGQWVDQLEVTLWAWDSGTDSGQTYDSPDQDTQPQQSIRLLASPHFLRAKELVAVGRAVVRHIQP